MFMKLRKIRFASALALRLSLSMMLHENLRLSLRNRTWKEVTVSIRARLSGLLCVCVSGLGLLSGVATGRAQDVVQTPALTLDGSRYFFNLLDQRSVYG